MKFSVIIPIYNTEKFLCKCLDSVINQTHTDLEIIIVNDGSPGNADEICRDYAAKDSRIKYIRQENQGLSVARNNGLAAAAGDYIYFLDSDDWIELDFFATLDLAFMKNPADMAIIADIQCPLEYIGDVITHEFVVKHEFLKKHPEIRFCPGLQPCEDSCFSFQILFLTDNVILLPEVGKKYLYNLNSGSISHNLTTGIHLKSCRMSLDVISKFHKLHKIDNERVQIKLTAFFIRTLYAIFLGVETPEAKKEVFRQTREFIKKHPLKKLSLQERRWFQENSDIFINARFYAEYRFRVFLRKFFSVTYCEGKNKYRYVFRCCGIKITFSHKKDNQ